MIRLYDWESQASLDLEFSLKAAGIESPTIFVNEDGFLPDEMLSAYAYFCGVYEGDGRPKYFNQVPVPDYWEITGNNGQGEVWEFGEKRATIFYHEPKYKRYVKNMDWLDKKDHVRFTDHFSKKGHLFARTFFTQDQRVSTKSYYDREGREVIVENFLTGDIILTWEGKNHFFENRIEFLHFYFEVAGLDISQIWYNSLSTPFLLSFRLQDAGQDTLFWQEDIGDDIPGNMKTLLASTTTRTQRIIVQKKAAYDKMIRLVPDEQREKISYLGYIYPEQRANKNRKRILIATNSDQIEQLDVLVRSLSDYDFHIVALTEMSQRLQQFEQHNNVFLYPNVSQPQLTHLYEVCDIYLDINHHNEIDGCVRRAFENNQLLLAFDNTVHQRDFILAEHIFNHETPLALVDYLKGLQGDFTSVVAKQRQAVNETPEHYRELLLG